MITEHKFYDPNITSIEAITSGVADYELCHISLYTENDVVELNRSDILALARDAKVTRGELETSDNGGGAAGHIAMLETFLARAAGIIKQASPYLLDHMSMTCTDDFAGFGDRIAFDTCEAFLAEHEQVMQKRYLAKVVELEDRL